jgi:hypothetical protein
MKTALSGVLFFLIGLAGTWLSSRYPMGELYMMGPGLFPFIISSGLIVCGLLLMLKGTYDLR